MWAAAYCEVVAAMTLNQQCLVPPLSLGGLQGTFGYF